MKKEQIKKQKPLGMGEHQLLSITNIMNDILKKTEGLPNDVKQSISDARDTSWKAFISEQEQSMVK